MNRYCEITRYETFDSDICLMLHEIHSQCVHVYSREIRWITFLMRPHRGCKTQTAILWPYVPLYIIRRIIYLDAAREGI